MHPARHTDDPAMTLAPLRSGRSRAPETTAPPASTSARSIPTRGNNSPMSSPRRPSERTDPHYTAPTTDDHTTPRPEHPHARRTRATPHPDVVAAAEFLLTEPDAHLYRRRYLDLITHTPGPDGTTITDYTAAEKYLITTATRRRQALRRASTVHAARTPRTKAEADDQRP